MCRLMGELHTLERDEHLRSTDHLLNLSGSRGATWTCSCPGSIPKDETDLQGPQGRPGSQGCP